MKKTDLSETRIKKYSQLRQEIEQEIEEINIQNANYAKLQQYQKVLDEIDPNIFKEVKTRTDSFFPNLKPLLQIEKEKKNSLTVDEVKKWLETIEVIIEKSKNKKKITDYVPTTHNEQFVKTLAKRWQSEQPLREQQLQKLVAIKKHFSDYKFNKGIDKANIDVSKLVTKTDDVVDKYSQKLERVIRDWKLKSKWLFLLILFSTVFTVVCLIIFFLS